MRAKKRICYFTLLLLITLPAACSFAAITSLYYLPASTFAEQQNNWQGRKEYTEEGLHVLVEFCVYDTQNLLNAEEQQLADALDLSGRYIYAYQIWNHPSDSTQDVLAFQLLTADKKVIPESAYKGDTGCYDDNHPPGVAPTPEVSTMQGAWEFDPCDMAPGVHSWFLVFSSDFSPVKGDYTLEPPSSDNPIPGGEVPEPGTAALLGGASVFLVIGRNRKKRRAT